MKKLIFITLLSGILSTQYSFSQTNPRMENPNYAQTVFFDDFDSAQLKSSVWNVSAHGQKDFYIWVDSVATVYQNSGNLNISMLRYPNYTTTDWNGNPITANFIAGQVETFERYSYGVYECNATFANQPGSFPAFWLMSGEPCNSSFNNEIDIVALKYKNNYFLLIQLFIRIFQLESDCFLHLFF